MADTPPSFAAITMTFSTSRAAAVALSVLPRKTMSRALGEISRLRARGSALDWTISLYCRAYDVDLADYELPVGGFESFDAFFTRRLKPDARPLDVDASAILSPADGRIEACGLIDDAGKLHIKGSDYTVSELLGGDVEVSRYQGGQFCVVYLSPRDYHRVHAPVSGRVVKCQHVDGTLYPVNRIGLSHVSQLFARNERVAVHQESAAGPICTVLVGAIGVGHITLDFEPIIATNRGKAPAERIYAAGEEPSLSRGEELGVFHLGSTVIVFLGAQEHWNMVVQMGDVVRMGQALARRAAE